MRMPAAIVRRLEACAARVMGRRLPDFVIGRPGEPYLERWFLVPRNRVANLYLHRFQRSDDDRALHDHPWWNLSIVLDRAYIEHTFADRDSVVAALLAENGITDRRRVTPGTLRFRRARTAHRIELAEGSPVVTLFLTGPRIRSWGFHCPRGWRHWREFVEITPGGNEVGRGCD